MIFKLFGFRSAQIMGKHICWNITTRCNATCKFCDRVDNREEISCQSNLSVLDMLIHTNLVNKITWTGGEALLYDGLPKLLERAYSHGISNNLITNGNILTQEVFSQIGKFLDFLTLSLDAIDGDVNAELGRSCEQFEQVTSILNMVSNSPWDIKVKINTVATKVNLNEIIRVADFINSADIYRWKVFKFLPLRNAANTRNLFDISDEEFDKLKSAIDLKIKSGTRVFFLNQTHLEEDYLLFLANGDFVVTRDLEDIVLFNPLTQSVSQNDFISSLL